MIALTITSKLFESSFVQHLTYSNQGVRVKQVFEIRLRTPSYLYGSKSVIRFDIAHDS
jgi:hypothetical protein